MKQAIFVIIFLYRKLGYLEYIAYLCIALRYTAKRNILWEQ